MAHLDFFCFAFVFKVETGVRLSLTLNQKRDHYQNEIGNSASQYLNEHFNIYAEKHNINIGIRH